MTVKDLLGMDIDIDVYDDVCEEIAIAFCGPLELTPAGYEEFAEVLDYECQIVGDVCVLHIDDLEGVWQKKLYKAKKFFYAAAGYCMAEDYDKWFVEED